MTNTDIRRIALEQSAVDCGCSPDDFLTDGIHTCISKPHPDARKYLSLPAHCEIVTYGRGIVVSAAREEVAETVKKYLTEHPYPYCFSTPSSHHLTEALRPYGLIPGYLSEYFLPETEKIPSLPCPYPTRLLTPPDFADLYKPEWSNALCAKRPHLDVLGVGAFDGDELVGFAACSADCESMRQIGIDVLPAYRNRGIASALTARLTKEILERNKVPFYCAAWSNLGSVRNALTCGFRPAWVSMTCIP